METQHDNIDVAKYLSVAIRVAEHSGLIIRKVYESGELQQQNKGFDDPVTIADLRVQKSIETTFKHFFPTLNVQGEESAQSLENVDAQFVPEDILPDIGIIKQSFLQAHFEKRQKYLQFLRENLYGAEVYENFDSFSTDRATVWIDPLDGTKDFTMGNLSAVTVLIGLAIDGPQPILNKPKRRKRLNILRNPRARCLHS
jgi:3'(2'), 5'-bisphosphate nucleotidase